MRVLTKAALVGAALLAFATTSASAAIVCSRDVCWHTHEAYNYPPDARVTVHDDNWRGVRTKDTPSANMKVAVTGATTGGQPGSCR